MASVLPRSRPRCRISIEQAEQEFDLLFDEYLRETDIDNIQSDGISCYVSKGDDRLEGRSAESVLGEESDKAYIPEEQLQQAAQRELIREVAHILQTLGDRYSQEHRRVLERADHILTALFTQTTALEFATFKNTVEALTAPDRTTADFVFVMCLSRTVVSHVGNAANKAKCFFRRYIGTNYIPEMADAGGVVCLGPTDMYISSSCWDLMANRKQFQS